MITKQTTFVLGAGFSAELGMPVGTGLAQQIVRILNLADQQRGDDSLGDVFRIALQHRDPRLSGTISTIKRALPLAASIDNLVEHYNADPEIAACAKFAITYAIVEAESNSALQALPGVSPELSRASGAAIQSLFRLLVQGVSCASLSHVFDNIGIINFNYDRCFEQYMAHAISRHSAIPLEEAIDLVASIRQWRPYGSAGLLAPPAEGAGGGRKLRFGDFRSADLADVAGEILTFSESRTQADMPAAQEWLHGSQQVIFLGCAYHPQNLRLLMPWAGAGASGAQIYGTYYRPPALDPQGYAAPTMEAFVQPAVEALTQELGMKVLRWPQQSQYPVALHPLTCRQLVEMYEHTWAGAT